MPRRKDDFPQRVLRILAKRVAFKCSNPDCTRPTTGPRSESEEIVNIGVGAHISAAAPGGPRFDNTLPPEQRRSPKNGIWLCQTCAKLIDNDSTHYTSRLLQGWKQQAEAAARTQLERPLAHETEAERNTLQAKRRELVYSWRSAIEAEKYDFIDYRSKFLSSAVYSGIRPFLLPEVIQKIEAARTFYVPGARGNVRRYLLLDEVTRIEREWGLP